MKKYIEVKIHTVPQKCRYYNDADGFWLSLLSSKLSVSPAPPAEKISLICAYDTFFAPKNKKISANIMKKAGKQL